MSRSLRPPIGLWLRVVVNPVQARQLLAAVTYVRAKTGSDPDRVGGCEHVATFGAARDGRLFPTTTTGKSR